MASFLSTSPLRGTTDVVVILVGVHLVISIHVPLAGDDMFGCGFVYRNTAISIHVPLAGDDRGNVPIQLLNDVNFYPRPPCGGRPCGASCATPSCRFLSTSPLRGTTWQMAKDAGAAYISIHVPLAGDDLVDNVTHFSFLHFYPRPPCGGRLTRQRMMALLTSFLSTSPLRGTTDTGKRQLICVCISIHVPLAGDDEAYSEAFDQMFISIHVPLAGDDGIV